MPRLLLASGSPRRRQLMNEAGYDFEICPSDAKEINDPLMNAVKLTKINAQIKATSVSNANPDSIVIGADTVVFIDKEILGKPSNMNEAESMLSRLEGKTHEVSTGVSIMNQDCSKTFHAITQVTFKPLSAANIRSYLNLINPLDKAGAYAAQEHGELIIEKYTGSYTNVVGLPMDELNKELAEEFNIAPSPVLL